MSGTFDERMRALSEAVGAGELTGKIVMDQAYAQDQHETVGYRHAPGRTHHYLSRPLLGGRADWMAQLAAGAVTPAGSDLAGAMKDVLRTWETRSNAITPIDFDDLPRSHHLMMISAGRTSWDRPAPQRRLTPAELAEKARRRR